MPLLSKINGQPIDGQHATKGDATGLDFQYPGLTDDGAWHDLDLSSIVPVGAVAVLLRVGLQGDSNNKKARFRRNGNSNDHTVSVQETVVADVNQYAEHVIACDANRIIEYKLNTVDGCNIWILGWWL